MDYTIWSFIPHTLTLDLDLYLSHLLSGFWVIILGSQSFFEAFFEATRARTFLQAGGSAGSAQLSARKEQLQKEPAVGPVLSRTLLAEMPELGTLNRSTAPALAGVAPYARDSGNCNGRRFIGGGWPQIRRKLYMAGPGGQPPSPPAQGHL